MQARVLELFVVVFGVSGIVRKELHETCRKQICEEGHLIRKIAVTKLVPVRKLYRDEENCTHVFYLCHTPSSLIHGVIISYAVPQTPWSWHVEPCGIQSLKIHLCSSSYSATQLVT